MDGAVIQNIAIALGVILFSMTLHEVMHGFIAYWLGDDTAKLQGRLTLNPIKHIDPFLTILLPVMLALIPGAPIFGGAKPVPFNPERVRYDEWGAALVALGGPLTNFVLAFIFFGVYAVAQPDAGTLAAQILMTAVSVNLGFFIFNMIPVPPLDGSRVIYALAPDFVRRGMEVVEQYGLLFVFAFVLLASSVIGQFMVAGIGFFVNIFAAIFGLAVL